VLDENRKATSFSRSGAFYRPQCDGPTANQAGYEHTAERPWLARRRPLIDAEGAARAGRPLVLLFRPAGRSVAKPALARPAPRRAAGTPRRLGRSHTHIGTIAACYLTGDETSAASTKEKRPTPSSAASKRGSRASARTCARRRPKGTLCGSNWSARSAGACSRSNKPASSLPGPDQMEVDNNHLFGPLRNRLDGILPNTDYFQLIIPIDATRGVKASRFSRIRGALADWIIATAPTLATLPLGGRYETAPLRRLVSLHRWSIEGGPVRGRIIIATMVNPVSKPPERNVSAKFASKVPEAGRVVT
jgi:hypothetical protein